ncbi:MAG: hypothetical protein HYY52_03595 [Candidatus Melainabacteria bacterium]|nr:hypothetical protein [Candidatus Melainabacteria bacterium]
MRLTETLRVCLEPLFYDAANYRHKKAIQTLQSFPPHNIDIDEEGNPLIPQELRLCYSEHRDAQDGINKFVASIYDLNGATRKLMQNERDLLNEELQKFTALSRDNTLLRALKPTPSANKKEEMTDDEKKLEPMTLDMSPEAQAGRAYMSAKRRITTEIFLATPFIPMLGVSGIVMAGPPYSLIIANSNGNGITHTDEEVRLGAINYLGSEVHGSRERYFYLSRNPDPFTPPKDVLAHEARSNLELIRKILSRKYFGANDRTERVRDRAIYFLDITENTLLKIMQDAELN